MENVVSGSCLCGKVIFTINNDKPIKSSYCHCVNCRKHTGAPLMLGVVFFKKDVTISGKHASYQSSEHGFRHFCPVCGSSLFFTFNNRKTIEIMAGVLNTTDFINPRYHLYVAHTIRCLKICDNLPTYSKNLNSNES